MAKPGRGRAVAPPIDDDAMSLWSRPGFLIRRLHQITVGIFLEEMADLDLTPVQFGALTVIKMSPGIEQAALGEELGIDRVNAGNVVQRLMRNDLVLRNESKRDRRYREVWLTSQGEQVLEAGTRRMRQVQARLMSPLEPHDQAVFLTLLMRLIRGNNDQGRALLRLPSTLNEASNGVDNAN